MRLKLVPGTTNWDFFRLSSLTLGASAIAGVGALVSSTLSFALYARAQFFGAALTWVVPASQRVATFAVIAFACLVARDLIRSGSAAQP